MKFLKLLTFGISLLGLQLAYASSNQINYIYKTSKQLGYIESEQDKVWPGFHPAKTPIIIAFDLDEEPAVYAFNFTPKSNSWKKLDASGNVFVSHSLELGLEDRDDNSFKEIEDQHSFIDIESSEYIAASETFKNKIIANRSDYYLKHESAINPDFFNFKNIKYDAYNQTEYLKLLFLEDAALTYSLQADDGHALEALKDAAAIHQYRNQILSDKAKQFEAGNEILLGIPNYISWISQDLKANNFSLKSQLTGCPPLSELIGTGGVLNCATSGFPTFSATVYGYHLDKLGQSKLWKNKVEQYFVAPSQSAMDYYHFSQAETKLITQQAMQKSEYRYERISKVIDYLMASYFENMNKAIKSYQSQDGIIIRLPAEFAEALALADAFGYEVFTESYSIDNHTTLFRGINSSFPGDNIFDLKINQLAFMQTVYKYHGLDKDESESFTELKLNEKSEVIINKNRSISVGELSSKNQVIEFNAIALEDPHFHLVINDKGKIIVENGVLRILSQ